MDFFKVLHCYICNISAQQVYSSAEEVSLCLWWEIQTVRAQKWDYWWGTVTHCCQKVESEKVVCGL